MITHVLPCTYAYTINLLKLSREQSYTSTLVLQIPTCIKYSFITFTTGVG